MPKIQVVSIKDLEGVAKESKRPYKMRIAGVVFTSDDGVCELGEITFMQGENRPLPELKPGLSYTPVIGASSRAGKLEFRVIELKPLVVAPVTKAA
jgi:hypothetical protein